MFSNQLASILIGNLVTKKRQSLENFMTPIIFNALSDAGESVTPSLDIRIYDFLYRNPT